MISSLNDISIHHLFEVPTVIPTLAQWSIDEWEPYYGTTGPGGARADLETATTRDRLPACLVAQAAGTVLGTIALKAESLSRSRTPTRAPGSRHFSSDPNTATEAEALGQAGKSRSPRL